MVEVPKDESKLAENNTVIMSSPQVKPEDVVIEHAGEPEGTPIGANTARKPKDDPIAELRKNQESAERALADEKERRLAAERERDTARAQVNATRDTLTKAESEKVVAQEAAILNRVETAKAEVENAERALEEAIDTGKPAKEQIALQKKLAEAVYKQKGAEGAKAHFDNWKEKEKNKPQVKTANDDMSPKAREWVDSHPKFNTDKKYKRIAVAAHEDAIEDGVPADSSEYFRRINSALAEAGYDDENSSSTVVASVRKTASGTSMAAPASHDSTGAGARGGNAAEEQRTGRRTFKLDGNMREQAIKIYGKNSMFKLSDGEAYKRYAARQLEIKDKRANGEKI
jgi:hypothetical protein